MTIAATIEGETILFLGETVEMPTCRATGGITGETTAGKTARTREKRHAAGETGAMPIAGTTAAPLPATTAGATTRAATTGGTIRDGTTAGATLLATTGVTTGATPAKTTAVETSAATRGEVAPGATRPVGGRAIAETTAGKRGATSGATSLRGGSEPAPRRALPPPLRAPLARLGWPTAKGPRRR